MNLENEVVERCRTRVGRSLGHSWRLDALIGIGGLGAVYAGSHRNGLVAAVKLLHPSLAATPDARAGFPRDVVLANRTRHPSTVAVLGDEHDPQTGPFLILELLLGETVESRALAAGGQLPLTQALSVVAVSLKKNESAHRGGIVHRDVRPRKLFLTSKGALKLLDLGLALTSRFRGAGRHEADSAPGDLSEQTGVASARVPGHNLAGRLRRTVTPLVLAGLDSLDPASFVYKLSSKEITAA